MSRKRADNFNTYSKWAAFFYIFSLIKANPDSINLIRITKSNS